VPGGFVFSLLFLALLSAVLPQARWGLAALGGVYTALMLVGAVITGAVAGWSLVPALPLVFATYHLGYGTGFLLGIWDFVVRPHGHPSRCVALTR
jgi:hypothetical protein